MNRMTMRNDKGIAFWIDPRSISGGYRMEEDRKDQARLDRLAAYEDTDLEPYEITVDPPACVFYCNRKCNIYGDWCIEGPGCPYNLSPNDAMRLLKIAQDKNLLNEEK